VNLCLADHPGKAAYTGENGFYVFVREIVAEGIERWTIFSRYRIENHLS
jgi:hypothetical protein